MNRIIPFKWKPIPISVGISLIAYLHYRHLSQRPKIPLNTDIQIQGPWYIQMYTLFPLRWLSQTWGELNSIRLPVWMRKPVYLGYSYLFGCNLDEMEEPDLKKYENLGQFFYRSLKTDARPIAHEEIVSPSDGTVLHYGSIPSSLGKIEQVKNVSYSVNALLGDKESRFKNDSYLHYIVIYLAPGDYHRFHSPVNWSIQEARHFVGEMFSVSPWIVSMLPNIFILNERISILGKWKYGFFSMIPVAATNVGNIHLNFEPNLKTNQSNQLPETMNLSIYHPIEYSKPVEMTKGLEMGGFKLGSTIVLVFEAPKRFSFEVAPDQYIKMGQSLGKINK